MEKNIHYLILSFCFFLILNINAGCSSSKHNIKKTSSDTEIVEAAGIAPVINNDIQNAKESSLNYALKNALGLVIGVYVSQEALVSKAMLIEDNITSQTEGYIEKYFIIDEYLEENFYKTKIRALVRKEDLSKKLKALELEPKRLGNPVVKFSIEEFVDGEISTAKYAEKELKKIFIEKGFIVSDSDSSDIAVTGEVSSNFNTDKGLGGLISYRSVVSIKVLKSGSKDIITTYGQTAGGVDSIALGAAKTSIINALKKASEEIPESILQHLIERSTIQISISNVQNINILNEITRSIRALNEVRDCWTRAFSEGKALIDLDVKKGNASEIAKRLETLGSHKLKVTNTSTYHIEAQVSP